MKLMEKGSKAKFAGVMLAIGVNAMVSAIPARARNSY